MTQVKQHISGYAGHVPGKQEYTPVVTRTKQVPHADLPGYMGYVLAIKPENIYGKSFTRMSKEVKCGSYYRTRPHFDENWDSINREDYKDPRKVDGSHNLVPTRKVSYLYKPLLTGCFMLLFFQVWT